MLLPSCFVGAELCPLTVQSRNGIAFADKPSFTFLSFFLAVPVAMWKFLGRGSNPGHRSDPSHCPDARSLTLGAMRTPRKGL